MVYRRCLALLKDEAEASDLMQDVFLRIFAGMDRLNLDSPSSLLWNTATRLCLNRIRDKKRRGLPVLDASREQQKLDRLQQLCTEKKREYIEERLTF